MFTGMKSQFDRMLRADWKPQPTPVDEQLRTYLRHVHGYEPINIKGDTTRLHLPNKVGLVCIRLEYGYPINLVRLSGIYINLAHRGNGYANRTMRSICHWADQHDIKCCLKPTPFSMKDEQDYNHAELDSVDETGMTAEQLAEWYGRWGFVQLPYYMLRKPNSQRTSV